MQYLFTIIFRKILENLRIDRKVLLKYYKYYKRFDSDYRQRSQIGKRNEGDSKGFIDRFE